MADSGFPAMIEETILESLPVVGNTDPSTQVAVSYQNYFDGVSYWTDPILPQNLIIPLRVQERQSGTQQFFTDVLPANDGLQDQVKTLYFGSYDWRSQSPAIWLPGAIIVKDLKIRFATYMADIVALGTSVVPIMRCRDALAHYVCAEFAFSRGAPDAATKDLYQQAGNSFLSQGQQAMKKMKNRDARREQRGQHRRIGYSRGRHAGWGTW